VGLEKVAAEGVGVLGAEVGLDAAQGEDPDGEVSSFTTTEPPVFVFREEPEADGNLRAGEELAALKSEK